MSKQKKCNFNDRARSLAEREVGCPLDHCECGTHDADNELHLCPPPLDDAQQAARNAELAAGWDQNP
jgi:hypothetical protein